MNEELKKLLDLSSRIRSRIKEECQITRITLYNWLNGKTPIPFWAKEKIDIIVMEETGNKIFSEEELIKEEEGGQS
ncbi:MAG: hypothetical protein LBV74_12270 [Tannerella sp.]|jgi:hypothetical protein|nr:hypothetical protein [Tannerella sp.]